MTQFPKNYFGEKNTTIPAVATLDKSLPRFRRKFREFILSLPRDAKLLDAGCGKGKFAAMILAYRPDAQIYAMDITDVRDFLPNGVKDFKVGSVEDLASMYSKNFFDAVISLHVIEHLYKSYKNDRSGQIYT